MHPLIKAVSLSAAVFASSAFAAPAPQSSDGMLTARTKITLWTTAGIRSTTVHVDTNEGVVTLYGKVPSEAQRALAGKTAGELSGVRSVQNLLQVVAPKDEKMTARSDKEIKEHADKQLKTDRALQDSKISVKSVDKGVVILTGDAHSYGDHLRAIVIVDRLAGVTRIATEVKMPGDYREDDRITFVTPPAEKMTAAGRNTPSDGRISMQVKLRLFTAAEVPSTEISVDTDDAVVTLFGIVPTQAVKNSAGAEAAKVSGVTRVDNELEVVATAALKNVEAKDADITRDLTLAFKNRPELKSVSTSVKNGMVMVTGSVPSGWDRLNALRIVRHVTGVRGLEDQLKVDAPQASRD